MTTRIYVTTDSNADIRAIAKVAEGSYVGRNGLLVSYDGGTFHTVLFNARRTGPGYFSGTITQPALGINDASLDATDDAMTLGGVAYDLDDSATIGQIVTKAIMQVFELVQTHAGYYVVAQNQLDGKSHDFLDGQPLENVGGIRARGGDIVADVQYVGHRYLVTGDHMDTSRQTATFDGQPATHLDVNDYEVAFADDLSSVTVTKK